MDRLLQEFFGDNDEPEVAPSTVPSSSPATTDTAATATAKPVDPDREGRREARKNQSADPVLRRKRNDFAVRYFTGDPAEGFTTEEAIEHLREMRDEMSPREFRAAMHQTLERLPGDRRDEFIAIMRQHKADTPAMTTPKAEAGTSAASATGTGSPSTNAEGIGRLLTGLMGAASTAGGGGTGGGIDDLIKSGLRALSDTPGEQPSGANLAELVDSPIAREVIGGLVAHLIRPVRTGTRSAQTPTSETTRTPEAEAPQPADHEAFQSAPLEVPQPEIVEAPQPPMAEASHNALSTALAHEQAAFADYQRIKAAGDFAAEIEAQERWEAAQQLVQEIQARASEPTSDFNQALTTALAHEQAAFADYQRIKAAGDFAAEIEAQERWEAAQQLVQEIQARAGV